MIATLYVCVVKLFSVMGTQFCVIIILYIDVVSGIYVHVFAKKNASTWLLQPLPLTGTCCWFSEEPSADGLHQCGQSAQPHS